MLAIVDLEERVPWDHPLRRIKAVADAIRNLFSGSLPIFHMPTGTLAKQRIVAS